ncbi:MAG TPA: ATP-grasp domain-containing protein [Planctomycetota bacterium]|nr:ATP-grasp domain-containing protein [Planctomycetota bacterium]
MKKLRVLVLVHQELVPPANADDVDPDDRWEYQMEYDVQRTLRELGHDVEVLGLGDELRPIRERIEQWKPHVVFNIMTDFHGVISYEAHVVSYLELLKQPYTGCNPRGIMLAGDKALSKQILAWHRIPCPAFAMFPQNTRKRKLPARMQFPVIVKSANKHGSAGISQASVVRTDEELAERVEFMHRTLQDEVIAEQFIEGREMTVSVVGNERLDVFPVWEMWFDKLPDRNEAIATSRVKWDVEYAHRVGLKTGKARGLSPEQEKYIHQIAKRAYRALHLSGYARVDLRMDTEGKVYVIEVNVNADLTSNEDFAEAAEAAGLDYGQLLQRILNGGIGYKSLWKVEE